MTLLFVSRLNCVGESSYSVLGFDEELFDASEFWFVSGMFYWPGNYDLNICFKNLIETMEIYCLMMNKIVFLKTIYPSGKLIIITCFSEVYSVVMCYLRLISLFLIVNWFLVSGKLNVSAPQVLTVLCVESCVIRVGCV